MGKGSSSGLWKKVLIALSVLALAAIIVVVILLVIPPNTYEAVETLYKTSSSSYLKNESSEEYKQFSEFKSKVAETSKISYYNEEIVCIETLSKSLSNTLDFYSLYLVYCKDNSNLKDNYKKIKDNLNNARTHQTKMKNIIAKAVNEKTPSFTLLQNAMIDFRREYISWLSDYDKGMDGLRNACLGSLGNSLDNNPAFRLTTNATNDMLEIVIEEFKKTEKGDKKGGTRSDYSFKGATQINLMSKFVSTNILRFQNVKQYNFDNAVKLRMDKIDSFYKLYGQKDLKLVLASAYQSGSSFGFSYLFSGVTDTDGVYTEMKNYLGGGV